MSNDPKEPLLLDHEYDGIRELDNKLPRWWVWLFYITIVIAAIYMLYYHVLHLGPLSAEEYKIEMKAGEQIKAAAMSKFEAGIPTLQPLTDPVILNQGRATYAKLCAPCHRADGGGNIGPNLTDGFWLHGGAPDKVWKTVHDGVPAKGMAAWGPVLGETRVASAVAYVITLRNTNVPNGKAPQGEPEP